METISVVRTGLTPSAHLHPASRASSVTQRVTRSMNEERPGVRCSAKLGCGPVTACAPSHTTTVRPRLGGAQRRLRSSSRPIGPSLRRPRSCSAALLSPRYQTRPRLTWCAVHRERAAQAGGFGPLECRSRHSRCMEPSSRVVLRRSQRGTFVRPFTKLFACTSAQRPWCKLHGRSRVPKPERRGGCRE